MTKVHTPSEYEKLMVRAGQAEAALKRVRALVYDTDGNLLDGESFDGLAGCVIEALGPYALDGAS
jgi:hypothetical protein